MQSDTSPSTTVHVAQVDETESSNASAPRASSSSAPASVDSTSAEGAVRTASAGRASEESSREVVSSSTVASDELAASTPNDDAPGARLEGHSVWVRDIVSRAPSWPIRYGNTTFLIVIFAALVVCWFIRYPDVVKAPVIFTTEQAPVRVVAPVSRSIDRLFAEEKETVEAGAPLVLLDNSASYADIQQLRRWYERAGAVLQSGRPPNAVTNLPTGLRVGSAQEAYMAVMQRLSDYKTFLEDPFRENKQQALESRIQDHRSLAVTYADQGDLLRERRDLQQARHLRNEQLEQKDMISNQVVEESKSQLLNLQFQLRDLQTKLANNRIQMSETNSQLADLRQKWTDRDRTLRLMFLDAYERLGNQLQSWRQKYLLAAPVTGMVTFFDVMQPGRHVQASENVLAVVPSSQDVTGTLLLAPSSVGHIKHGQKVMIALDSPSSDKVGKIRGVVGDVSLVSGEKAYRVRVHLPDGLVTEFGHELELHQEMPGTAEVVTEDHRLLMRVFNWLRVLVSDNVV